MSEANIKTKIPYFNIKFKLFDEKEKEEITTDNINELLNKITCALPNWNFWYRYNISPPILVIDEANLLRQLGNSSNEGAILLKLFLNWLVENTKHKHFHAILISSNSFFLNWLLDNLYTPYAIPYVVGDLSREEAEEYFEKHILPQYECEELRGKFNNIRRITGTRMLIIDKYVKEYKNNNGKLKDSEFSIFKLEEYKLKLALHPESLKFSNKPPPAWKYHDLIKTMMAIVKVEDQGFILEDDLINIIGSKQVYSLIDYNYLFRRPTNKYANDIINPPDKVILTAINQPSLRAMECLLSKISLNSNSIYL
ncbi:hypothetical protein C1645_740939 [Glomus cerebriforme]|uniref:ATPase domain-containing protein n=1 Tax=Glomus cerebriforme TaxID=658196 RepID=A0A397SQJ9_9GLOM|nr:hypothetical protein C1645_740939 [Glomus cerebriforme]